MDKRSSIIGGMILIAIGGLFLLLQTFPEIAQQLNLTQQWPLLIIALGGLFLFAAFLGTPPLAIPGTIIAGLGGILYYQNFSGNWASWAYVWTLIPGFVGLGLILSAILTPQGQQMWRAGGRLLVISAILFVIFAAFFNGFGLLGNYWPLLLIAVGMWMLLQNRRQVKLKDKS